MRQFAAVLADDLHVDAEHRAALLGLHRHALLGAQRLVLGLQRARGAQRAHLGHAPGVQHLHVVALLEGAHHRRRAGRAADDGAAHGAELRLFASTWASSPCHTVGTPAETVTPSASNSSCRLLPSRNGPGKHQLGADHAGRIRQAPGIDVEHRHHRQDHVARRAVQRIGQRRGVGVQHASSGGCTARPSGCPWCPTCSTATRRCSRRTSASRSRSLAPSTSSS